MALLIVEAAIGIDGVKFDWVRSSAPDIESVAMVDSIDAVGQLAAESPAPVVTMVNGEQDPVNLRAIATTFVTHSIRGGVLAVGRSDSCQQVTAAFLAGVHGWMLGDSPVEELITGIRAVANGHVFLPAALLCSLAKAVPLLAFARDFAGAGDLTSRELDVVELLSVGKPDSQIAADLFISPATVHSHVLSILRKFNARNRTEAVARAYQHGIVASANSNVAPGTPPRRTK